tara:strand:+ start:256 stop:1980 length:1725 start_codon:yes stop_codon:yes gene_type:complete
MGNVIGIGHDLWIASAALYIDGNLQSAIPEERINRLKGYQGFPGKSISNLLSYSNLDIKDIDLFCIGWNPSQYFNCLHPRFSKTPRWRAEMLYAIPNHIVSMGDGINIGTTHIQIEGLKGKFAFYDHHMCHSFCSYYLSDFEESINISIDGRGERKTSSINTIVNGEYKELSETLYPSSLGLFYGSFTQLCGFRPHSDEWKFMALGALSNNEQSVINFKKLIDQIISLQGYEIVLDMSYFSFDQPDVYGKTWTKKKLLNLLKIEAIDNWDDNYHKNNIYYDLSKAVQLKFEEIVKELIKKAVFDTGIKNITITGGCAMNSVCNGKLHQWFPSYKFFIPPYPDDSGISIGAAIIGSKEIGNDIKKIDKKNYIYTGINYEKNEILKSIQESGLNFQDYQGNLENVAKLISQGNLIGCFNGRSEFGQRALGNRSILGDPRKEETKALLNKAVKYREVFRPFAPAVLHEYADLIFEDYVDSYFMERVLTVKMEWRTKIPAVVHFDNTARLQTVTEEINKPFYNLISAFYKVTGVPLLVNTSFNLNGEPNVENPRDAIRTFFSCGLDYLILGDYLISKK